MTLEAYPIAIVPKRAVPKLTWPVAFVTPSVGGTVFSAEPGSFYLVAKDTAFMIAGENAAFNLAAKDTIFSFDAEDTAFNFQGRNNARI